jgi:hypothetical protein
MFKSRFKFSFPKPNTNYYKILIGICSVVMTVFSVYLFVWAGNIDSPAIPSNDSGRMYTLENIYNYLNSVDSAVPSKPSGGFTEPSAGPAGTMYTTDSIFTKLVRLPATGQTTVYQTNDDGTYQSGATLLYADNGDGTITDSNTKLMWVKQPELIIPGAVGVTATNQIQVAKGNWAITTAYVAADLVYAIETEAVEGITVTRSETTVTSNTADTFTAADVGRTIVVTAPGASSVIRAFTNGTTVTVANSVTDAGAKTFSINSYYVCAVAHTSGGTTFTADITANPTYWRETTWTGSAANLTTPLQKRWDSAAILDCEALDYAGYTDWRLPNLKELISIVNYEKVSPAINTTAFPNTQSTFYWSSTPYADGATFAWFFSFYGGNPYNGNKTLAGYVRCVRGQ